MKEPSMAEKYNLKLLEDIQMTLLDAYNDRDGVGDRDLFQPLMKLGKIIANRIRILRKLPT